jgi:hypothetical protein
MAEVILAILIFCGIYEGKVFLQITDRNNNILGNCNWEAEVTDRDPITLNEAIMDMVTDNPEDLKFFLPKGGLLWFDGQKLLEPGTKKIADCEKIENPTILRTLGSYAMELIESED